MKYAATLRRIEMLMRRYRLWRGRVSMQALVELHAQVGRLLSDAGNAIDGRWAPHVAEMARAVLSGEAIGDAHERWISRMNQPS